MIRNLTFRPGEDLTTTLTVTDGTLEADVLAQVRLDPTDLDADADATFAASVTSTTLTLSLAGDTELDRGQRYLYDVRVEGVFVQSGFLQVLPTVSR